MCWWRSPPRQSPAAPWCWPAMPARQQYPSLQRGPQSRRRPRPACIGRVAACGDAAASEDARRVGRGDDVRSRVLGGCFHDAGFRSSGFAGLAAVPASATARQRAARRWVPRPAQVSWRRSKKMRRRAAGGCRRSRLASSGTLATAGPALGRAIVARGVRHCCRSAPKSCPAPAIGPLARTSTARSEATGWRRYLTYTEHGRPFAMIPPSQVSKDRASRRRNKYMIFQIVIEHQPQPRGRRSRFVSARRQELPFARAKAGRAIASRECGLYERLTFSRSGEANSLSRNRLSDQDRNHAQQSRPRRPSRRTPGSSSPCPAASIPRRRPRC